LLIEPRNESSSEFDGGPLFDDCPVVVESWESRPGAGEGAPMGELTPSVDGTVFAFFSGEAPSVAASGCGGTTSAGATAAVLAPQPIFHELRGSGRLSLSKNLRCNGKKQRCRGDLELVDAARSRPR
jgi:hypothetical protein